MAFPDWSTAKLRRERRKLDRYESTKNTTRNDGTFQVTDLDCGEFQRLATVTRLSSTRSIMFARHRLNHAHKPTRILHRYRRVQARPRDRAQSANSPFRTFTATQIRAANLSATDPLLIWFESEISCVRGRLVLTCIERERKNSRQQKGLFLDAHRALPRESPLNKKRDLFVHQACHHIRPGTGCVNCPHAAPPFSFGKISFREERRCACLSSSSLLFSCSNSPGRFAGGHHFCYRCLQARRSVFKTAVSMCIFRF